MNVEDGDNDMDLIADVNNNEFDVNNNEFDGDNNEFETAEIKSC